MHFLKRRSIFSLGSILMLALLVVSTVRVAFAGSGTGASATINPGSLSLSAPTTVKVGSERGNRTANYLLPLTVVDATGSGAGWNLTITSTRFTSSSGDGSKISSSILKVPMASCTNSSTCTLPANTIAYSMAIPAGNPSPPAVKFFNATRKTGLGSLAIRPKITIMIPRNTHAGSYKSTLTVSVCSSPSICGSAFRSQNIMIILTIHPGDMDANIDTQTDVLTVNYLLGFSVNGSGNSDSSVTITSTQFATETAPMRVLPTTASLIASLASACQTGQNCPEDLATYPIAVPAGNPTPNPVMFYDAPAGIGTSNVMAEVSILVPADDEVGTYTSTITIACQIGP